MAYETEQKRAIVIGAGPAGLTAAYELLSRAGIRPIVLEQSQYMGGLSRTVLYKGNRIDIGGHRFFSKSDRAMQWWLNMLPLKPADDPDRVMLERVRKSRILYLRRFFDYPISLSWSTLSKLGLWRTVRIGLSYLRARIFPPQKVETLDQFFIGRFGRELYRTFFRSYTEKVWGAPCHRISAKWGAQRVKGLSVLGAIRHALRPAAGFGANRIAQKGTETSLIERFLYPKLGPGQMWEEVAGRVRSMGGEIHCGLQVDRMVTDGFKVVAVEALDLATGCRQRFEGDYFFSTAPIQELMRAFTPEPPRNVLEVSDGLVYRDFITVGVLVRSLRIASDTPGEKLIDDTWIYIQEPDVRMGRLQIFNNWSPSMVADAETVWLGLEYFCNESDSLWGMCDESLTALAQNELVKIGLIDPADVLDATVLRMKKTYPAYFGSYDRFAEIRRYVDGYENLFLMGRNGMHCYNNQDHSMLTAMVAVDNILSGEKSKDNIWQVNTEMEYHEAAASSAPASRQ